MEQLKPLIERTDEAREANKAIFKSLGYTRYPGSTLDSCDCIWGKRDPESQIPIHFNEHSWIHPPFGQAKGLEIRPGNELTYIANTWTNNPHMRFEVHGTTINSKFDILAAEAKILKFIKAFGISRQLNFDQEGIDQSVIVMGTDLYDRTSKTQLVKMRMHLTRESCHNLCLDMLQGLEERRETWEDSYVLHFGVRAPAITPVGIGLRAAAGEDGEKLFLKMLADWRAVDNAEGRVNNQKGVITFQAAPEDYIPLRREILEELSRLEGRLRHG